MSTSEFPEKIRGIIVSSRKMEKTGSPYQGGRKAAIVFLFLFLPVTPENEKSLYHTKNILKTFLPKKTKKVSTSEFPEKI